MRVPNKREKGDDIIKKATFRSIAVASGKWGYIFSRGECGLLLHLKLYEM